MITGTWRFKCRMCGMFGRGDKSLSRYMAMRHGHDYVEVWCNGSTSREHVRQASGRGLGMKFMEDDE